MVIILVTHRHNFGTTIQGFPTFLVTQYTILVTHPGAPQLWQQNQPLIIRYAGPRAGIMTILIIRYADPRAGIMTVLIIRYAGPRAGIMIVLISIMPALFPL